MFSVLCFVGERSALTTSNAVLHNSAAYLAVGVTDSLSGGVDFCGHVTIYSLGSSN